MRLIAFITNTAEARKILEHIGVDSQPPRITPPRGPPLWDNCDAPTDEVLDALPDWDQTAQPEPDDCADQRIHWFGESKTSESDPLSGRVVPQTHQDNPKWHTSEKTGRFDCQTEDRNVPKWEF